ncbi:bacteriohemerythrin [Magnetococcus sp. PR-3]|uniref:bacteriohemerythrin n=1 Tax=Magnetococcus sp. PR-3 TaxID=3120355 RepID=UPI003FA6134A
MSASQQGADASREVAESAKQSYDYANEIQSLTNHTQEVTEVVAKRMDEASDTVRFMQGSSRQFDHLGDTLRNMSNALFMTQLEMSTGTPSFDVRRFKSGYLAWQSALEKAVDGREPFDADYWFDPRNLETMNYLNDPKRSNSEPKRQLLQNHEQLITYSKTVLASTENSDTSGATKALEQFIEGCGAAFTQMDALYLGREGEERDAQPFFPWRDSLSVGVAQFDQEHQRLIDLINQIQSGLKRRMPQEQLSQLITELASFTDTHFSREEGIMKKHGYPGLGEQQDEHRGMVAKLHDLAKQHEEGEFSAAMDLMGFARAWLTEHILETDMRYKPFFAERGVK